MGENKVSQHLFLMMAIRVTFLGWSAEDAAARYEQGVREVRNGTYDAKREQSEVLGMMAAAKSARA